MRIMNLRGWKLPCLSQISTYWCRVKYGISMETSTYHIHNNCPLRSAPSSSMPEEGPAGVSGQKQKLLNNPPVMRNNEMLLYWLEWGLHGNCVLPLVHRASQVRSHSSTLDWALARDERTRNSSIAGHSIKPHVHSAGNILRGLAHFTLSKCSVSSVATPIFAILMYGESWSYAETNLGWGKWARPKVWS